MCVLWSTLCPACSQCVTAYSRGVSWCIPGSVVRATSYHHSWHASMCIGAGMYCCSRSFQDFTPYSLGFIFLCVPMVSWQYSRGSPCVPRNVILEPQPALNDLYGHWYVRVFPRVPGASQHIHKVSQYHVPGGVLADQKCSCSFPGFIFRCTGFHSVFPVSWCMQHPRITTCIHQQGFRSMFLIGCFCCQKCPYAFQGFHSMFTWCHSVFPGSVVLESQIALIDMYGH